MPPATRPTEKLLRVAKGGVGRRQQFSTATRRTLVDVARQQFATRGYAGTSLDAIVAGATVTKGALYHHFSGKQALFEAVFEDVERDAMSAIAEALTTKRDPWDKAMDGLRAFLRVVREPTYQRIVIQEGPAVLGYERFREQEERSTFGLVRQIVHEVLSTTSYGLDEEMMTTFTQIFFGAMSAAGESVSTAADPEVAVARVETAIGFILLGLRTLAEQGAEIPTVEP
ncbi:MAG: transcriptional regulator, TetR family [Nocardioidaceae bacterium]|nr:transcriptional regulator, TetR family [Nocardioidaceae bacterium]